MRLSSFGLLSLLPPLIGALPFDNSLSNELRTNSYQRQDLGLFHGPRRYINTDDGEQLIPIVLWLPQSTLLRSSPRYRRGEGHDFGGDSGHDSGVSGECGHGSDISDDSGHDSDVGGDSGHGADVSDDSGHGSDISGDSGHDLSDDNAGLVPLSTGVIDPSDPAAPSDPASSDDTDPSGGAL